MASSNTQQPSSTLELALQGIPQTFRPKIIDSFTEIRRRFTQAIYTNEAYDAIGISAGKFCETVLRFLQHELTGTHTRYNDPIRNFGNECNQLEQTPRTSGHESLRVMIPRCLSFAYTVRNKRGIGHTGGDVEANKTDILVIVESTTWIVCELIRIYYGSSLEEAQGLVDTLSTRKIPDVWEVMGRKRVLKQGLSAKDRALLICYTTPNQAVLLEDLFEWVEYSSMSMFRSSVIKPLHEARMIEQDKELDAIIISPIGVSHIEANIIEK